MRLFLALMEIYQIFIAIQCLCVEWKFGCERKKRLAAEVPVELALVLVMRGSPAVLVDGLALVLIKGGSPAMFWGIADWRNQNKITDCKLTQKK